MNPRRVVINKEGYNESIKFTSLVNQSAINESYRSLKDLFDRLWTDAVDEQSARQELEEATYTGSLDRSMMFFFSDKKTADKFVSRFKELASDYDLSEDDFKTEISVDKNDDNGVMLTIKSYKKFDDQKKLETKARDAYLGLMREGKEVLSDDNLDENYSTDREDMKTEGVQAAVGLRVDSREVQDDIFERLSEILVEAGVGHQVSIKKDLKFHNNDYECKISLEQYGARETNAVQINFDSEEDSISFFTSITDLIGEYLGSMVQELSVHREVKWKSEIVFYSTIICEHPTINQPDEEEAEKSEPEITSPFTSDNE